MDILFHENTNVNFAIVPVYVNTAIEFFLTVNDDLVMVFHGFDDVVGVVC